MKVLEAIRDADAEYQKIYEEELKKETEAE
jgi:hypothetical protein